jgi:hypothetical protein
MLDISPSQKIGLNMNTATKKPGLQALAFSTAIRRILHFFTFSHAQFISFKDARRAILPYEILGTPVTKYSLTYGANWISQCAREARILSRQP